MELLELAQRQPLRLPDRLSLGLDLEEVVVRVGHRRALPFFRFTRRGGADFDADAGEGFGAGDGRFAPSPPPSSVRGGVREVRFGRATRVRGTKRLVIRPCPTVHRVVVAQQRTSGAWKLITKGTMKNGSSNMSVRCVLSIVVDMKNVEAN